MRIKVTGDHLPITEDKRVYAEYRFFTAMAPYEVRIRSVDVAKSGATSAAHRSFLCRVVVDLGSSGRLKTQARAVHQTAAIDRAADRTAWLVSHRARQSVRLESSSFSL
jgi:ribosome-associated translation inhibitor RaiA